MVISRFGRERRRASVLVVAFVALVTVLLALSADRALAQEGTILRTAVEGPVTPVMADHLADAIAEAEAGGHEALIVTMDTPGGVLDSTRDIVQSFLTAEVPVVVYVSPAGARAASAGAIITFSSHVAAMAPGTNIGAATPVDMEGGEVIDKVVEDSAAYVAAVAEERDRNVDFAVDTVREGRSAPVSEAVEVGAVDLSARTFDELLAALDGRTVSLQPNPGDAQERVEVTLSTSDAAVVDYDMSWTREILQLLANPNLTVLLLGIAPLAILYELINPSEGIGAIAGGIMLILGFFSVAMLPVTVTGIILLLLAAGLFAAEMFVPGIGAFAGGGAVALVLAGLFLFQEPSGIAVDLSFLVPIALALAFVAVVIGRFAIRSQRRARYAGQGGETVGATGTVKEADGENARVFVSGSTWRARSADGKLERGDRIRVVDVDGLTLVVAPDREATDR